MPPPAAADRTSPSVAAAPRAAGARASDEAGPPRIPFTATTASRATSTAELRSHRAGSMRWRIEPGMAEELLDGSRLRLAELSATGRARIVKTGPHRTVHRLALPSGACYLKQYRVTDWAGLAHNAIRPCKAECELRAARRAAELGVRTYEIVGIGRVVTLGLVRDSYLLTKEIADAVGLDEFAVITLSRLPEPRRTRLRQQVARRAGELTARLHQGGFLHRDYHSENLLVRMHGPLDERDDASLWLIDLHPVDFARHPSAARLEGNLALLANFLWQHTRPIDRLRFARAWWETFQRRERENPNGARLPYATFREFARRAGDRCYRGMLRAAEIADRRWERGNRKLIIADRAAGHDANGPIACRGVSELGRKRIEALRDDPERWLAATVFFDAFPRGESRTMRFPPPKGAARFFRHRWTPARRAWEMGHAFVRRGIGAARPLWFASSGDGESLLTEEIPGALSLATILSSADRASTSNCREGNARDERLRDVARVLADRLRLMRDARFVHRALAADRIFASAGDEESGVWFAGMESVHAGSRIAWLFGRQFRRMLARFEADLRGRPAVTMSLRARFLRRFLGTAFRNQWKRTWRDVAREAARFDSQHIEDADRAK